MVMPPPAQRSSGHKCVDVIQAAYSDAVRLFPNSEKLLNAPRWRQAAARTQAIIEGTPPGVIGQVSNQRHIVHEALSRVTRQELHENVKTLDRMLYKELPKMQYVGPPQYANIARQYPDKVFMEYPQYFSGASPKLRQAFNRSAKFNSDKIKLAKGLGYPIEEITGRFYFEHMWDDAGSPLTARTQGFPEGRVSVAKEREFDDYIQGIAAGRKPSEHTVGEIIEHSSELMDKAIADALERRIILERFGTQTKTAAVREFNAPLYKGWYAPPEIVNFVDQIQSPPPPALNAAQGVSAAFKNTAFGLADIGVFGVHVLRAVTTGGPQILAAALNRGLATVGLPHFDLWLNQNLTRAMNAQVRGGVTLGQGPSAITLGGGTIVKYIPFAGKYLDRPISAVTDTLARVQFGGILTPIRVLRYEGDLMMLSLLGRDINNPRILRQAGDWANVSTGASRGAQTATRRGIEAAGVTSFQMVRAEAAQWMKLANTVFNPRTSAVERMLGLTALASLGATIYGLGSAININFGNGKPVEWDPRKSNWSTVELGGREIPLIPQRALIRAIGKSVDALQNEDPERLTQIWTQYAAGKLSPLVGGLAAGAGFGFDRERGFRVGDLSPEARLRGLAPLPPIVETAMDPEERNATSLGLSYVGLNSWPVSMKERKQRKLDELFEQGYFPERAEGGAAAGVRPTIDNLLTTERAKLKEDFPELFSDPGEEFKQDVREGVSETERDVLTGDFIASAKQTKHSILDSIMRDARTGRLGDLSEDTTRKRLWEEGKDALDDYREKVKEARKLNPSDWAPEDPTEKRTLDRFFRLIDSLPDVPADEDWARFDKGMESFTPEELALIEQQTGVGDHPFELARREANKKLDRYWEADEEARPDIRAGDAEIDGLLWAIGNGKVRSSDHIDEALDAFEAIYGYRPPRSAVSLTEGATNYEAAVRAMENGSFNFEEDRSSAASTIDDALPPNDPRRKEYERMSSQVGEGSQYDSLESGKPRENFREQNPEIDAILWVLGKTSVVRSAAAGRRARELYQQLWGVTPPWPRLAQ